MILGSDSFYVVRAVLVTDPVDTSTYYDWNHATQTLVTDANVQPFRLSPRISKEDNADRQYEQTFLRVYAPYDTDVLYTDRVLFYGKTYDIFGQPNTWRTLEGIYHHSAFIIRLREG
jgi:hypothetical protein